MSIFLIIICDTQNWFRTVYENVCMRHECYLWYAGNSHHPRGLMLILRHPVWCGKKGVAAPVAADNHSVVLSLCQLHHWCMVYRQTSHWVHEMYHSLLHWTADVVLCDTACCLYASLLRLQLLLACSSSPHCSSLCWMHGPCVCCNYCQLSILSTAIAPIVTIMKPQSTTCSRRLVLGLRPDFILKSFEISGRILQFKLHL